MMVNMHHEVHYVYVNAASKRFKGYSVIMADSVEKAEEAFRAVFVDSEHGVYEIIKVVVSPLHFV